MNKKRCLLAILCAFVAAERNTFGNPVHSRILEVLTRPVVIQGNEPYWTRLATVQAHTRIRVYADGAVKFGLFSTTDTAIAGVEGNTLFKFIQGSYGHGMTDNSGSVHANSLSEPVNFKQGGVWIKILNHITNHPAKPTTLYYYWAKIGNLYGLTFESEVDIYAKAHDGGRDPESTCNYGDNTGYYRIWLALQLQPPSHHPHGIGRAAEPRI